MSQSITVSHCSLYGVPRAGINIGDGTWVVTSSNTAMFSILCSNRDHGAFNSWGRDRWWAWKAPTPPNCCSIRIPRAAYARCHVSHTLIRNDGLRAWLDIDLDDGSTNFHIVEILLMRWYQATRRISPRS